MRHANNRIAWHFLVTGLLLAALLFCAGCSGGTVYGSTTPERTAAAKPPPPPPPPPADPAIAFTGSDALMVMNADGTNVQTVYEGVPPYVTSPSWSPAGQQLAFGNGMYELGTVNLDGTGYQELVSYPSPGAMVRGIAWSPGAVPGRGSRIAYTYAGDGGDGGTYDIWLIDQAGGDPENITGTSEIFEDDSAWAPDASKLAYTTYIRDYGAPGVQMDIWVRDFSTEPDTVTRVELGGPFANSDVHIADLNWSRQGDRIAFAALTEPSPAWQLWVVDLGDPANPTPLTDDPASRFGSPSWSPDDSMLVYLKAAIPTKPNALTYFDIWKMKVDGSELPALLLAHNRKTGSLGSPDWRRY